MKGPSLRSRSHESRGDREGRGSRTSSKPTFVLAEGEHDRSLVRWSLSLAEVRRPVRFGALLESLVEGDVDFIVVGGVAAVLEGAPVSTFDLDIVYSLDEQNMIRLEGVLRDLEAIYVDPAGRSIAPTVDRLREGGHHLLRTRLGRLDALGSVGAEQSFDDLLPECLTRSIDGLEIRVLKLEAVIATKEIAGRAKDRAALDLLRQTLEERERSGQD